MKTTFSILTLFFCICFLILSCTQKQEEVPVKSEVVMEKMDELQGVSDTISKAVFEEWVSRWRLKGRAYEDTSNINYFTMPLIDLNELLGESPAAARFYMGLDSISIHGYMPHIILVGTGANGEPRLNTPFHIYDVTTVCPPACGKK